MIRKQYTIAYWLVFLGLYLLFAIFFRENIQTFFDLIIALVLIALLVFVLNYFIARLFSVKLLKILTNECDPDRYLSEYDSFYKISDKSMNKHPIYFVNRYSGLIYSGRYTEARQTMENAPAPELVNKQAYYPIYYVNAAHQNILDGNYDDARQKLDYIRNLKLPKKHQSIFINAIDGNEAEILRKQGHLPESRALLNEVLSRKIYKLNRLVCIFALGLIDVDEQKYNDARTAFSYVIAEGNKLNLVVLAKQEVGKIDIKDIDSKAILSQTHLPE